VNVTGDSACRSYLYSTQLYNKNGRMCTHTDLHVFEWKRKNIIISARRPIFLFLLPTHISLWVLACGVCYATPVVLTDVACTRLFETWSEACNKLENNNYIHLPLFLSYKVFFFSYLATTRLFSYCRATCT